MFAAGVACAACQLKPDAEPTQGDTGADPKANADGGETVLQITQAEFDATVDKRVDERLAQREQAAAAKRKADILGVAALLAPDDADLKAKAEKAAADSTISIEAFRKEARDHLADKSKPVAGLRLVIDAQDKLNEAVALSVVMAGDTRLESAAENGGDTGDRVARRLGFENVAAFRKAHATLQSSGMKARKLSQILGFTVAESHRTRYWEASIPEQFRMLAAHGTGHFPAVLENIANKSIAGAMALAQVTWREWCAKGEANDFREASIVNLSNFRQLSKVEEFGIPELLFGSDRGMKLRVYKYMGKLAFTIEMLRNDDKGALTQLPRLAAMAASHGPEALVCNLVNNAQTLTFQPDGVAVVHTDRGNLLTGAALTPDSAEAADLAMSDQVDFGDGKMPIRGEAAFVLVPPKLKGAAQRVYSEQKNWTYNGTSGDKPDNIMKGKLKPIVSPYFSAKNSAGNGSDTRWTVLGNPNVAPAIVINFLDGKEEPSYEPVDFGTNTMIGGELMFAFGADFANVEAINQNNGS